MMPQFPTASRGRTAVQCAPATGASLPFRCEQPALGRRNAGTRVGENAKELAGSIEHQQTIRQSFHVNRILAQSQLKRWIQKGVSASRYCEYACGGFRPWQQGSKRLTRRCEFLDAAQKVSRLIRRKFENAALVSGRFANRPVLR
eukprot:2491895-Rhodomonas_salina.2